MTAALTVLLLTFALDVILGDPIYPLHPVRIMGHLIHGIETVLFRLGLRSRFGGVLLLGFVQSVLIGCYLLVTRLVIMADFHESVLLILFNTFMVYSCLSIRDLSRHGKAVLDALKRADLTASRQAVQMLIGRDANQLDIHGVARAAVESLAENFIDGFLAPIFWFCLGSVILRQTAILPHIGGTGFILFYRMTNTLDSMVGYKNEKYLTFGTVSARLDDLLNFIPARLGIVVISLASLVCGYDAKNAWKTGWRDRLKHSSPNAGHPEACVGGALHIKLNGPGIYPHGLVEKPWIGDGTTETSPEHLKRTNRLVWCAAFLSIILGCAVLLLPAI